MKTGIAKYIIFTIVFVYSSLWIVINLSLSSLGQEKFPVTVVEDHGVQQLISDKTGVNIENIKISESPHPFGMMVGIPTRPQLILSRGLYDAFTPDEMEYVVIHEAGHYALWHGVKEFVAGLILFMVGIYILRKVVDVRKFLVYSILLGLFFGILMVQLGKAHELQADNYTVKRMENPTGMIEATKKFRDYHGKKYSQATNPLIKFMFYRANPYDNRIKMAQEEIDLRAK
ncbi:M48 family metallopeptidase [Patescibacteria group bacterium]